MSELHSALAFKTNIGRHLAQLSQLTGSAVREENLLSLLETGALRERSKANEYVPSWRRTVAFSEKAGRRFQRFVESLEEMNSSGVYIWTPLSNVCGLHRPVTLKSIHWEFDFELIPDGILVLLTADIADKMLLDFSEGPTGKEELEIEVSGPHWARASI